MKLENQLAEVVMDTATPGVCAGGDEVQYIILTVHSVFKSYDMYLCR